MDKVIDFDPILKAATGRVRAWQRFLDENIMGVDCANASQDFRGSLKVRVIDSGSINRSRFTRQTMRRTPALIRQAKEDTALIVFIEDGRHTVRQGDRSATLDGAGVYCLDGSRPFEVDFASDEIQQAALLVPKAAITSRVGPIEDLAFGPATPLQRLLSTFAKGVIGAFEELDAATLDALLNQTLDLFALMVAQGKGHSIDPSTHRAGTLLRIKSYIGAHLHDEELTLERTARALGISSRYVNALLATEGTSFGRYLLAARLDGARRDIMDPRRAHKQVAEVAFGWGFKNPSHFGRAFKEKYGLSPRDARSQERLP